ncbi:MAG TPA: glycosyltransferase family 2 protein [Gaiellaceae bacterium]|jgi:cellulose synthase/poly-beta-1,6-N-acetylglucosamine synthase-like glycosyltransferase|nr:glycosyltransferase family 2 protein [Gaiellaceae bacterium]
MVLKAVFWGSFAALAWTHGGYPLAAALLAKARPRPVAKADVLPSVALVVAAHDEERQIGRLLESLLALDYPPERLEILVVSDGSTDRTEAIVEEIAGSDARVRLLRRPRGGKVAAQDAAVRRSGASILAFSDANAVWAPDALRELVRNFADPEVAYVCGRLQLEEPEGTNREGLYWRYELWTRRSESALGSVTAGNGAIYGVRREDYVEGHSRFGLGHDLGFPYLMVQRGRRAVYEPGSVAYEPAARETEDEFGRKTRILARAWVHVLTGRMLRGLPRLYLFQVVSHRLLRYASGLLHVVLLTTSALLAGAGAVYAVALGAQLGWLVLAVAGRLRLPVPGARLAWYYLVVAAATVVGLARLVRQGPPLVWERSEGAR